MSSNTLFNDFDINGKVSIEIYDSNDVLKSIYSNNNSIHPNFKDLIASALVGSYTSKIKPENIAMFSNPSFANSSTGTINLSGLTAGVNNQIVLSASVVNKYGVQYTIFHKNPATGSVQTFSSFSLGFGWNTTYNQWNNIVAFITADKLNIPLDDQNQKSIKLQPKERITFSWEINIIPNVSFQQDNEDNRTKDIDGIDSKSVDDEKVPLSSDDEFLKSLQNWNGGIGLGLGGQLFGPDNPLVLPLGIPGLPYSGPISSPIIPTGTPTSNDGDSNGGVVEDDIERDGRPR